MKNRILLTAMLFIFLINNGIAQKNSTGEKYGKTLNLGVGLGYYSYIGYSMPVLHLNYEIDVARNFTLAPFITYYRYEKYHYWGNSKYQYKNYAYYQTVIPIGLKGTYYFDQFLKANSKWDFYLAASLGVAVRKTTWEEGYYGDQNIDHSSTGLYLDGHIGAEYHINTKIGLLLDLSTGQSTFCLAIHM